MRPATRPVSGRRFPAQPTVSTTTFPTRIRRQELRTLNGVPYLGTGGNTGSGVTGVRETGSTNPGTALAGNNPPVTMTQAQAQAYFPANFLGQTVPSAISTTTNWNADRGVRCGGEFVCPIRHIGNRRGWIECHHPDASADPRPGRHHQRRLHHPDRYLHPHRHLQRREPHRHRLRLARCCR